MHAEVAFQERVWIV